MSENEGPAIAAAVLEPSSAGPPRTIDITSLARQCRFVTAGNYFMLIAGILAIPATLSGIIRDPSAGTLLVALIIVPLFGTCGWTAWRTRGGLAAVTGRHSIAALLTFAVGSALVSLALLSPGTDDEAKVRAVTNVLGAITAVGGVVAILTLRRTRLPYFDMRLKELLRHGLTTVREPHLRPARGALGLFIVILVLAGLTAVDLIPNEFLRKSGFHAQLGYVYGLGCYLLIWARHFFQPDYQTLIREDPRRPILYLRAFVDDENVGVPAAASVMDNLGLVGYRVLETSLESGLAAHYSAFGPFVALAGPQEVPLGAVRVKLTDDEWQAKVLGMMREASLVIMVAGIGRSLKWELETLARDGYLAKTVIMLPKLPRRGSKKPGASASPAERLDALCQGLAGTPLAPSLEDVRRVCRADQIRAIACAPGGVVAMTTKYKTLDSYYIGSVIGHYLMQPWKQAPATATAGTGPEVAIRRRPRWRRVALVSAVGAVAIAAAAFVVWRSSPLAQPHVNFGESGRLFYSAGITPQTARAVAAALHTRENFANRGDIFLSREGTGTVLSVVAKDQFWNEPDIALLYGGLGMQIAPLAGGLPLKIRILDARLHPHKEIAVGIVDLGDDNGVLYFGSARETAADAKALADKLKAEGFFEGRGRAVGLVEDQTKMLLFALKDGAWNEASAVATWSDVARRVAPAVRGLPIEVRLTDRKIDTKKEWKVQ